MRAMDDAVENGIGKRGITQVFVPAIDRQLAGDDGRAVAVSVIQDLEQILALQIFESDEAPIIEDQDVDAREACEDGRVRAVAVCQHEFGKEARNTPIDHAVPVPAGLVTQRARHKGLADTGRAGDEDVVMLGDQRQMASWRISPRSSLRPL